MEAREFTTAGERNQSEIKFVETPFLFVRGDEDWMGNLWLGKYESRIA